MELQFGYFKVFFGCGKEKKSCGFSSPQWCKDYLPTEKRVQERWCKEQGAKQMAFL